MLLNAFFVTWHFYIYWWSLLNALTYFYYFTCLHIHIKDQNTVLKYSQSFSKTSHSETFFFLKHSSIEYLLMSTRFHLVPSSVLSNAFPKCLHYITVWVFLQAVDSRYLFCNFLMLFDKIEFHFCLNLIISLEECGFYSVSGWFLTNWWSPF